ncbi:MAG: hypothetical protein IIW52_02660 [Alistipes sp.]|nr:hypothetical protein [Alistipes sp.]
MPRLPQLSEEPQQSTQSEAKSAKKSDKYVDMKSDAGRQTQIGGEKILIAVGNFAAHHNGTIITCDSTVRYSDSHLECFGNVLINKGSTFIYGDRADYDGEKNEAHIFSDIIKVVDGTTTMYTYNFTFNTKSNVGTFTGGGVVIDENNRLEAERGYYNADTKDIICVEKVQMRDEKYQMKGDSVIYNMESNNARFFRNTNIWNTEDNEYLYADCGEFHDAEQLYRLTENGYILTEEQELWSDSLDYYRDRGYALLKHNIQIDDTKNKIIAFGDWGEYWKEPGNAFLTSNPSMVSYDAEQGDSLFIRSDSMFLYTKDPVAERLERERLAKLRQDSIAFADSLQRVAKLAEKERLEAERAAKEQEKEQTEKQSKGKKGGKSEEQTEQAEQSLPVKPLSTEERKSQALDALEQAKSLRKKRDNRKGEQAPNQLQAPAEMPQRTEDGAPMAVVTPPVQGIDSVATDKGVADSLAVKSGADSLKVDSLTLDSLKNPLDTLTVKERKALQRAAEKAAKQHIRDSVKKVKADSLRVKLDRIADRRQAQKTAYLKKLERQDSIRRAKIRLREDKRLSRRVARLTRRGIEIKPVHDSVFRAIDSLIYADSVPHDSLVRHMLDSIIAKHFPRKEKVDTTSVATDTVAVDSTYKLIMALRNVRMFRSDAQMVCDSLITRSTDSVIHLYKSPVLWNEENQITSDSMHIYNRDSRLSKALFEGHPMTVAQIDTAHYNQVAGKEMIAFFNENNEIYRNDVNGNVQTIYYMQDEGTADVTMMAYIESGDMTAYIENRQLKGITYRTNPTYYFYPIDKIPEDREKRLKGFGWHEHRRPSRDSVMTRAIRPTERTEREEILRPTFPIEKALILRKERLLNMGRWKDRTDTLSVETIEWVESVKY